MSSDEPLPPWLVHPDIPAGSIGWRMGGGEEIYDQFYRWFSRLTDIETAAYIAKYPEPDEWAGKYAQVRAHPWK